MAYTYLAVCQKLPEFREKGKDESGEYEIGKEFKETADEKFFADTFHLFQELLKNYLERRNIHTKPYAQQMRTENEKLREGWERREYQAIFEDLVYYLKDYYLQQFLHHLKKLPEKKQEEACKTLLNYAILLLIGESIFKTEKFTTQEQQAQRTELQTEAKAFKKFFFQLGLKSRMWKTVLALVLTFVCVLVVSSIIASLILLHAQGNGSSGHHLLQLMSGLLSASTQHIQSVLPSLTEQSAQAAVLGVYLSAGAAALFTSGLRATQPGTRLEYVAPKVPGLYLANNGVKRV